MTKVAFVALPFGKMPLGNKVHAFVKVSLLTTVGLVDLLAIDFLIINNQQVLLAMSCYG